MAKISTFKLNSLKPSPDCKPNRPDKHFIEDGLFVYVRVRQDGTAGSVSFVREYKHPTKGTKQTYTIGKYGVIKLKQAQNINTELSKLIADGIDPNEAKKQQKAEAKLSFDFDSFAQAYLLQHAKNTRTNTSEAVNRTYRLHVKPAIGHLDIRSITIEPIRKMYDSLANMGKVPTADAALQVTGAIFEHAKELNPRISITNPISRTFSKAKHKKKPSARIPITELHSFLNAFHDTKMKPLPRLAMKLMLYVFLRTNELLGLRWAEIDFVSKEIRLPSERMKEHQPHIVPLSEQAIQILLQIKQMGLSDTFVFASRSTETGYLCAKTINEQIYKMGYKGKMTGHGFRGLASTSLYQMLYNPRAIELQLSHVVGGQVERAYNDNAHLELLPQRRLMLQQWADVIDQIEQGDYSTYKERINHVLDMHALTEFLKRTSDNPEEVNQELQIISQERQQLSL